MTAFSWAILTACIWGVVPLMEKAGLAGGLSATGGVMVRSVGVVVGLAVFGALKAPWAELGVQRWPSLLCLAGGGFLASFVGQLAFYQALKSGALSQVTPVAGAYPLVAALLGWAFLHEPLSSARGLGVVLIVTGILLLRR